jgi:antirestriction protein ArdC
MIMARFKPRAVDAPARDIYQEVTDKIVAQLEKGVRPWTRSWGANAAGLPGGFPLRANGKPYRGVNVSLLWIQAAICGYASPYWMTFKQALELGGCVRKGEKSATVTYMSAFDKKVKKQDASGQQVEQIERIRFLKFYHVFNASQVDGLPGHFYATRLPVAPKERIEAAEAFFARQDCPVVPGYDSASYSPHLDMIRMPVPEAFKEVEDYYSTLAHEHVHSTGHASRLDRQMGNRFGSEGYAVEELIAELGAAFVCATIGISSEPRADHASYVANWLQVLKNDKKAIFKASTLAQAAADYMSEKAGVVGPEAEDISEPELAMAA